MNEYELLYIIPHTYPEIKLPQIYDKIEKLIQKYKGDKITREELGKKRLAYPIKGIYHGYYILNYFSADPSQINNLYQAIKLTDEILRHIIVKKEDYTPKHPTSSTETVEKTTKTEDVGPIKADINLESTSSKTKKTTQKKETSEKKNEEKENQNNTAAKSTTKQKKITIEDLDKTLEELSKIDESLL